MKSLTDFQIRIRAFISKTEDSWTETNYLVIFCIQWILIVLIKVLTEAIKAVLQQNKELITAEFYGARGQKLKLLIYKEFLLLPERC